MTARASSVELDQAGLRDLRGQRSRNRSTSAGFTLVCAALVSVIWYVYYLELNGDHLKHIRQQKADAHSVAAVVERTTHGLLKELDRVSLLSRQHFLADRTEAGFRRLIGGMRLLSDFTVQISIADASGQMLLTSLDMANVQSVSIADREHFKVHLGKDRDQLFIGRPVLGRLSGRWTIQLTRPIRDPAGALLGVVIVSLNAEELVGFYRKLLSSDDYAVSVLGADGVVRAGTSQDAQVTSRIATTIAAAIGSPRPQTAAAFESLEDGRYVVAVPVSGFEAWVAVARSMAPAPTVTDWLLDSRAAIALGLALILSAFTLQIRYKALRREQQRSADLAVRENQARALADQLGLTLGHMSQGLLVLRPDGRIALCNDKFNAFVGLAHGVSLANVDIDELIAAQLRALDGDELATVSLQCFAAALRPEPGAARAPIVDCPTITGGVAELRTEILPDGGGFLLTFTDVTPRRDAELKVRHIANHDPLTNLANRMMFKEALCDAVQAARGGVVAALLMIDLDRFKSVNDTMGHPGGDRILKAAADRILAATRQSDIVARIGGDEFAVLMREFRSEADAFALGRRLVERIGVPFSIDDHTVDIGASVGIAFLPRDGADLDELMKSADLALYDAKSKGKGRTIVYSRDLKDKSEVRRSIEHDLRLAIEAGQFVLHYQPIVAANDGGIVSYEALLRWKHPQRGMISPAEFIPIAEECGLIVPIGEWVIEKACHEASTWPPHVTVAVNLSAAQFRSSHLEAAIEGALLRSNLVPQRLVLEITESVVMAEQAGHLSLLHRLVGRGIGLAMDDFGTGYSSLSYLQKFPFHHVKIDGSFVRNLGGDNGNVTLVRSIVDMVKALGMQSVAECIETEAQRDCLRDAGCTLLQGYYFGRPMPGEAIAARFTDHPLREVA